MIFKPSNPTKLKQVVSNSSYEIESIIMYKFKALQGGAIPKPDKKVAIDITLQVQETSLFESIFSPVMRAELAVADPIGLVHNFPISGEEAIFIKYKNTSDQITNTLYFIIEDIGSITYEDDGRIAGYVIKLVAIEAYANALQRIQQSYEGTTPEIAKKLFDEHIDQKLKKFFPSYKTQPMFVEQNETMGQVIVIPNKNPFAAMAMLTDLAVNENDYKKYSFLFYQDLNGFNFRTLQGIHMSATSRDMAIRNTYRYLSNEISDERSGLNNEGRVITSLHFPRRIATFGKMAAGFFHNNLFEINIAQKSLHGTHTKYNSDTEEDKDQIETVYENKLNTKEYSKAAIIEGDDEQSNRTRYIVTTNRENDENFPVTRYRYKWGKELITTVGMSQVDIVCTIVGTNKFFAGSLFSLEIVEPHGFNDVKPEDLISGIYVITEVKHILTQDGKHYTVLRMNRDSYMSPIDRDSKYV